MRTTCTTGPIVSLVGQDEAIRLIAKGGYDCLDFSLGNLTREDSPWLEPDYKEKAAHVVELCSRIRLSSSAGKTRRNMRRWRFRTRSGLSKSPH